MNNRVYVIFPMCVCSVCLLHAVRLLTALSWQRTHGKPCRGAWLVSSKYVAPWIILPGVLMLASCRRRHSMPSKIALS